MNTRTVLTLFVIGILFSCSKPKSSTTGWDVNNHKNGGFQANLDYQGQETGPGLVFIEGGTFTMGRLEDDVMYDWNNQPRRVTVSSFYMDETEVTNVDYLEYLHWLKRVFGETYPEVYENALPDTLVWRSELAYNEPYVQQYLRHPAYHFYPVVGVTWMQANDYCKWRTDRVNEQILVDLGIQELRKDQYDYDNFNTEAYLYGLYYGEPRRNLDDIADPDNKEGRIVRMEDGIFLPKYRLPTEAEWEYASLGLIGNTEFERVYESKVYPWSGRSVRNADEKFKGQILANFKRGKGDQMGIASSLNDNADITAPVKSYPPNDFGLYDMAGNVNEWVMDVYRSLTNEDSDDFRAFRGNYYETYVKDEWGYVAEVDSLGRMQKRPVTLEENLNRRNYKKADNINIVDGDLESSIFYEEEGLPEGQDPMYEYGISTLIKNGARVYKGGSWKDRAYWMIPGNKRFLDEDLSTDDIGFRCAMHRVGTPTLSTPHRNE